MCGIAGLMWTSSTALRCNPRTLVDEMANTLAHRGPDSYGNWVDSEAGVALSHRRLAIVDLSATGAQPMASACGRYVLSYNGEVYNYQSLRQYIEQRAGDWNWRGTSDTEVLLALFSLIGVKESLIKLDGMFALAVWDRQKQTMLLARDRFGEKPLSYSIKGGLLAFGSELQAIRCAMDMGRQNISPHAIAALLSIQTIPAPLSIFSGVNKLPAASYIEISKKHILSGTMEDPTLFWSASAVATRAAVNQFTGSFEDAVNECRLILSESIKSRMIADVPLGSMLSSGIDSTCVTALAQASSSVPIKTYTISVNEKGFDEADAAADISRKLGTSHTTIPVRNEDCLAVAQEIATHYDEPFADHSQIVTFLLARAIRTDVSVALSGDGGDELFAGYTRHVTGSRMWARIKQIPSPLKHVAAKGCQFLGEARLAEIVSSLMKYGVGHPTGEMRGRIQKAIRSVTAQSEAEFYGSLISQSTGHNLISKSKFNPTVLYHDVANSEQDAINFLRNMLLSDVNCYLPETIMTKVDRASMAVGLEARAPFLNARLLEFSWSLPTSFLVRNGQGKAITRALAAEFVGQDALSSPKQGFAVPLGNWLSGPLKEWASDIFASSDALNDPHLNMLSVQKLWDRHLSGAEDCSGQIWPVLSYLNWKARLA